MSAGASFLSVFGSVRQTCFYIQCSCPSLVPSPSCVSLAVSDGGSAAQLDDHLLAVVKGPLVSQLLQGASCVGQHAHPLARSRQKRGGKVAACQHHSLRLLPLAWPRLALLCTQKNKGCCYCGVSAEPFDSISHQQTNFCALIWTFCVLNHWAKHTKGRLQPFSGSKLTRTLERSQHKSRNVFLVKREYLRFIGTFSQQQPKRVCSLTMTPPQNSLTLCWCH